MPSKSLAQQRLMGLALSIKRGKKSLSSLPKGLQSKVEPLLKMSDKQLSDFAKRRMKELVQEIIQEILAEDEQNTIAGKTEEEIVDFKQYLQRPGNIGISFTQKEKDSTNVNTLPQPIEKGVFEIKYRSTEDVPEDGKFVKTNKMTILKKIKVGENKIAYKTFTLIEPTQKPTPQDQAEKPKQPETKKVISITSRVCESTQGDPELLVEFLKDIDEDIGI